jgi:hypothetical protein
MVGAGTHRGLLLEVFEFLVLLVQLADEANGLLAQLDGVLDDVLGGFDLLPQAHLLRGFGLVLLVVLAVVVRVCSTSRLHVCFGVGVAALSASRLPSCFVARIRVFRPVVDAVHVLRFADGESTVSTGRSTFRRGLAACCVFHRGESWSTLWHDFLREFLTSVGAWVVVML